jgi:hypothetical protein
MALNKQKNIQRYCPFKEGESRPFISLSDASGVT